MNKSVLKFDATTAWNSTANSRITVDSKRYKLTEKYIIDVIYNEVKNVSAYSLNALIHVIPPIYLNKRYLVECLRIDGYRVKSIGRVLFISW